MSAARLLGGEEGERPVQTKGRALSDWDRKMLALHGLTEQDFTRRQREGRAWYEAFARRVAGGGRQREVAR